MTAAIGVTASASPARTPATSAPPAETTPRRGGAASGRADRERSDRAAKSRRVRWCTIATVATPARASGTSRLHDEYPKSRTEMACTQNAAGGLSTVMNEPGSSDPKKNAFQLTLPLLTAAA
jgi:hypothetical protein